MTERLAGTGTAGLAEPNRGEPELIVAADPAGAALAAAERIAAALTAAVERRGRADFCTTGGSTPIPIYRLLADPALREAVPWPRVHVWWGDDRFVPRGHPDSNVTALDQVLLGDDAGEGGAPLPAANIHPFPNDRALAKGRDNAWSAARYAQEMAAQLPRNPGNWPVFDLMLVGVGDDAHLLSVFPEFSGPGRDGLDDGHPRPDARRAARGARDRQPAPPGGGAGACRDLGREQGTGPGPRLRRGARRAPLAGPADAAPRGGLDRGRGRGRQDPEVTSGR